MCSICVHQGLLGNRIDVFITWYSTHMTRGYYYEYEPNGRENEPRT